MQPVDGHPNLFHDWMDAVHMYIENPTIDGFVLNHTGKIRFEKLRREKELKVEKENLELQKLRTEVLDLTNILFDYPTTKWRARLSLYISILAVIIAGLAIFLRITQHDTP